MTTTIQNNLEVWDEKYDWAQDGDEWDGQARFCNQLYEDWKSSLIETFLHPNLDENATIVEIAPGHGRWSKEIVDRCRKLVLVDLSPSCIEFCRDLLADRDNVEYIVNDGRTLTGVQDGSVDFVWSFDSFVHMEADVIASYLREIRRVLQDGGRAILHHAARRHSFLWLGWMRNVGPLGINAYKWISMGKLGDDDGWRSNVSKELFGRLAQEAGLTIESQVRSWGRNEEYGIPRYRDVMTILRRRG